MLSLQTCKSTNITHLAIVVLYHSAVPCFGHCPWCCSTMGGQLHLTWTDHTTTPPPHDSICHLDTKEAWISVKHGSLLPKMCSKNKMEIPKVTTILIQQYFLVVKVSVKVLFSRNESIARYPNAGTMNFCHHLPLVCQTLTKTQEPGP